MQAPILSLGQCREIQLPRNDGPRPVRAFAIALVHHARLLGYAPLVLLLMARRPLQTATAMGMYWGILRNTALWNRGVHKLIAYGSSNRPRWMHAMKSATYDPTRKYLLATHPHGLLCCAMFNGCARAEPGFSSTGSSICGSRFIASNGRSSSLMCKTVTMACPYRYPVHGEMYGNYCSDSSAATVRAVLESGLSAAICPEAVYTGASDECDHTFLAERCGFIKIAIEQGVDIAPMYTFGLNDMYSTPDLYRHERAVLAQRTGIPMLMWSGKYGTSVPLTDDICSVCLEPFPTSKYTVDQLGQASEDYIAYIRQCFEQYKGCVPSQQNKRLVVIGANERGDATTSLDSGSRNIDIHAKL